MALVPIGDIDRNSYKKVATLEWARRTVSQSFNSIGAVRTEVQTTATKIELPENSESVLLKHIATGAVIWIGQDENITANGQDVYPLTPGEPLLVSMKKGNSNNLYAIVESETAYIYAMGAFNA